MGRASPSTVALLLAFFTPSFVTGADQMAIEGPMLGPHFAEEPPSQVPYAADQGVRLRCQAEGTPRPTLTWLRDSGEQLLEQRGTRRIYDNGTLDILPSGSGAGAMTLRCRAANAHGVALSRDVTLDPVAEEAWEARVEAPTATEGGVACITCGASKGVTVVVRKWFRGDRPMPSPVPPFLESRYVFAGNSLLIRAVRSDDAGAYSCEAQHRRSGRRRRAPSATLQVIALAASGAASAGRGGDDEARLEVDAGDHACLPCVAPLLPPTAYTWFREREGRLEPAAGERWAGGAALCVRATRSLSGAWLCRASHAGGDAARRLQLLVREALAVSVRPRVAEADAGADVRLSCSASDERASLAWLHDGAPAGAGPTLLLRASRGSRGVYQCVGRRGADSAQAAAELRLGEFAPELHYTFIERALRAGGGVSLRCAASGSPPPRFSWLRDDCPLDAELSRSPLRFRVEEAPSSAGSVAALLNVSAVSAADGGRYTCRASNRRGHAEHSARLNIYGPPAVRALSPIRVVAGANATVYCPYAGYPISSVWWRRVGASPLGEVGRLSARGAELRLRPALAADAGGYSCTVEAPGGARASADLDLQVRNPPKISPFVFSSELTEGSTVQVLCGVSSGDRPIYFSWTKDGAPLPPDLQIEEKNLNEFSLLMFPALTARHAGAYTCRASNHAAVAEYTATLAVKVPPVWTSEPADTAVLVGERLEVRCAARGQPTPQPQWERRFGSQVSLRSAVAGGAPDTSGDSDERWEPVPEMSLVNGMLLVEAVLRAHAGQYRCRVDNGVPPPLLRLINVTVHEPARVESSSGNVTSVRGSAATLECQSRGDAPLTVNWMHRGDQLDLDSHRWTVAEVRTAAGLRSALRLRVAERTDAGEYRCRAHNHYGASEALIYLHVEEPPDAPQELRLDGVGSRWVRLRWRSAPAALLFSASCEPLPSNDAHASQLLELMPENIENRVDGDGLKTFVAKLENLKPAVSYALRISAANRVGRSPQSEPLLVTTLEEAPTASPQNVQVEEGSASELRVSWLAPPRSGWNGELLGFVLTWREIDKFDGQPENNIDVFYNDDETIRGIAVALGPDATDLVIAGLRPFSRYALQLRAFNRAGTGPVSVDVMAATSDVDISPRGVTCEAISSRDLRVRWSPTTATSVPRVFQIYYAAILRESVWSTTDAACCSTTLRGLSAGANHSVWLRALPTPGRGEPITVSSPSAPVYCSTPEDAPGAIETVGALPVGSDVVRVTWLQPAGRGRGLVHFTLHTKELGKASGERIQRVDAADDATEVWAEVRGLRPGAAYEVRVRAEDSRGAGPMSRPVTATPPPHDSLLPARVSSLTRDVRVRLGGRGRLPCAAVGTPPLRRHWTPPRPLPTDAYSLTDDGDFLIHSAEATWAGEYACHVRNAAGADAARVRLTVLVPPAPPRPRLVRVANRALLLAWEAPSTTASLLLGYTVRWRREGGAGPERNLLVAPGAESHWLRGLGCGTSYLVWMQAHAALGDSPSGDPLHARTPGHQIAAPPANRFVWANDTALRLNLLAWLTRDACPVTQWRLTLRPQSVDSDAAADRRELGADGELVEFSNLRPSTWYEIRVEAHSMIGDSIAVYRAATLTRSGERLGDAVQVTDEKLQSGTADEANGEGTQSSSWRLQLAPALAAGALVSLLAVLTGAALLRRRAALGRRDAPTPPPPPYGGSGKTCAPADDEQREISPYATFSMGGAGDTERALRLRTCGGADAAALAAAPRPCEPVGLHVHDSDSESSGSPCAACAAELYRLPAAHLSDTLPAAESSADDTSCSAGSRRYGPPSGMPLRGEARSRRRRDAAPLHWQPTLRCSRVPPWLGASQVSAP